MTETKPRTLESVTGELRAGLIAVGLDAWADRLAREAHALGLREGAEAMRSEAARRAGWRGGIGTDIAAAIRAIPVRGHLSDCAVHNEPAMPNGPCSCGLVPPSPTTGDARTPLCPVPNCHAGMLRDHNGRDSVSCPVCDGEMTAGDYIALEKSHGVVVRRASPAPTLERER